MLAYVVVGLNYEGKLMVYNRHKQWASADSSKARIYYLRDNATNIAKVATESRNNDIIVATIQAIEISLDFKDIEVKITRRS